MASLFKLKTHFLVYGKQYPVSVKNGKLIITLSPVLNHKTFKKDPREIVVSIEQGQYVLRLYKNNELQYQYTQSRNTESGAFELLKSMTKI